MEGLDHRVFPKDSYPDSRIMEEGPSPEEILDVMPIATHQTEEEIKRRFMCMRNAVDDQRRLILTIYDMKFDSVVVIKAGIVNTADGRVYYNTCRKNPFELKKS